MALFAVEGGSLWETSPSKLMQFFSIADHYAVTGCEPELFKTVIWHHIVSLIPHSGSYLLAFPLAGFVCLNIFEHVSPMKPMLTPITIMDDKIISLINFLPRENQGLQETDRKSTYGYYGLLANSF